MSFKLIADRYLQMILYNWNASKIGYILGEEPTALFYNKMFAKYQVIAEEGLLTPTQRNYQAQQLLEINERFGREVFPPSMIVKDMNIQGKAEAVEYLKQQEQAMQEAQQEKEALSHAYEDARLKELYSKAMSNIAMARERHGRAEADIGLFEERLSEITHNRAMATKAKMEALEKLVDVIAKYGEIESMLKLTQVEQFNDAQSQDEDVEKADAKRTSLANQFKSSIMMPEGQIAQQGR
jgi:hypothetical protein